MQLGAVAGAVSIVMPVHDYFNGINNNIALTVALIAVLIIICGAVLFFAVTKLVSRPLRKLEHAAQGISTGDFDVDLPTHHGVTTDEVDSLSFHIQGMAIQLSGFYKNLETMVENRTTELEAAKDELNALNARLVEANDRLMRENDYKSEYLAIMSHELRTPLTSLLAFAEMWDSDLLQGAAPNADAVGEVRANARILLRIVDNILEMSRIEAGQARMTPEPVDVVDVLSVVARTMEPLARRKDITLTFAVDDDVPIIMSDYEMLRRILDNLMSNAVKYTHRGGSVIAHACYDAADDMLRISVSDDGIGLKEDEMANIFERFVQHSASSYKKYSGTGLGLAVVSELVNLLGGDIEVRSVYKQGSTFTVSLPVQR
jgi:signal transduction histidine kinase